MVDVPDRSDNFSRWKNSKTKLCFDEEKRVSVAAARPKLSGLTGDGRTPAVFKVFRAESEPGSAGSAGPAVIVEFDGKLGTVVEVIHL